MKGKITRTGKPAGFGIAGLGIASLVMTAFAIGGDARTTKAAGTVINAKNQVLNLQTNKGMLIRLPQPAASVFLAAPGIADVQVKSSALIYIFGQSSGETTLYATDANDNVIFSTRVRVEQDLSPIYDMLKQVVPNANVTIRSAGTNIILTGTAMSPAESDTVQRIVDGMYPKANASAKLQIVNQLTVITPTQINLRVKFAEIGNDVMKQLGFKWDAIRNFGNLQLGYATSGLDFFRQILNPAYTSWLQSVANAGLDLTQPGALQSAITRFGPQPAQFTRTYDLSNVTGNALYGGAAAADGSYSIGGIVDALQTGGFIHVLAEPNLTAMSGETASFLAGGEFPVPIPQGNTGAIAIEYKTFGVKLDFVPVVITSDRVTLRVSPEVSELSSSGAITLQGIRVPAISTRRVETTVELGSGETFALAGLLQNSVTQDTTKTPLLGDLPILGALFKSEGFRRRETELVVLVTPYIVKPIRRGSDAMTPTDGYQAPSDAGRILHDQTFKPQPAPQGMAPVLKNAPAPAKAGKGSAGFDLD